MTQPWKEFLQSLLNATLVLGIIFALSGIFLVSKVHSFAVDVLSDVKVALLHDMDNDIALLARSFQDGERDLRRVGTDLEKIMSHPEITLSPQIQQDLKALRNEVRGLNKRLEKLASDHEVLTDNAVRTLASSVAQAYIDIRGCRAPQARTKQTQSPSPGKAMPISL